jgi:adenine-specific DNA glycosylase
LGRPVTPVEIDDQLMGLGGTVCTDDSPNCSVCNLNLSCQANSDIKKVNLKNCYT